MKRINRRSVGEWWICETSIDHVLGDETLCLQIGNTIFTETISNKGITFTRDKILKEVQAHLKRKLKFK